MQAIKSLMMPATKKHPIGFTANIEEDGKMNGILAWGKRGLFPFFVRFFYGCPLFVMGDPIDS